MRRSNRRARPRRLQCVVLVATRSERPEPQCESVSIRPLVAADADFAALLHAEALPHGFFASLGHRYLRAYYMSFLDSPHGCAFAAGIEGAPIGFVVGSLDPVAHRRSTIRRHGARLALEGGRALVRHPGLGFDFLSTRLGRYTKGILRTLRPGPAPAPAGEHLRSQGGPGVLSHVAVLPAARGWGAGEALVDAFVMEARRRGVCRLELLTLAEGVGASSFYAHLGWRRGELLVDGDHQYVKFELELG